MQDLQNQFAHIKSLIQAKRYSEARTLLKSINHPKAQEWLVKLDQLDPPQPEEEDIFAFPSPSAPSSSSAPQPGSALDWLSQNSPPPNRPPQGMPPPSFGQRRVENIQYTNFDTLPQKGNNMGMFYILVGIGIFIFVICIGCAVAGNMFGNALGDTIEAMATDGFGSLDSGAAYSRATQRGTLTINGSQVGGTISSSVVAEKWVLQVSSTKTITIRSFGTNGYDTTLILYDANGIVLATADDTIGLDPKIDYTPASTGTYYVVVKEWGTLSFVSGGSYTLIATQ